MVCENRDFRYGSTVTCGEGLAPPQRPSTDGTDQSNINLGSKLVDFIQGCIKRIYTGKNNNDQKLKEKIFYLKKFALEKDALTYKSHHREF